LITLNWLFLGVPARLARAGVDEWGGHIKQDKRTWAYTSMSIGQNAASEAEDYPTSVAACRCDHGF
jgi:hypothetical protein